jgi:hypothetical protein
VYPANIDRCDHKADANGKFDKHSESQKYPTVHRSMFSGHRGSGKYSPNLKETLTTEDRSNFDKMIADADVLSADITRMQAVENFNIEQESQCGISNSALLLSSTTSSNTRCPRRHLQQCRTSAIERSHPCGTPALQTCLAKDKEEQYRKTGPCLWL